jgi:hypothetical protein
MKKNNNIMKENSFTEMLLAVFAVLLIGYFIIYFTWAVNL